MDACTARRIAAFLSVGLLPSAAAAQFDGSAASPYDNEVTTGTRWQSERSPVFGRYNGLTKGGFSGIGAFSLRNGDDWRSGGTRYFDAAGRDLAFQPGNNAPEAGLDLDFGKQGTWGVSATYDAITYTGNTIRSVYDKQGDLSPRLTAWGGAPIDGPASSLTNTFYGRHPDAVANAMQPLGTGIRQDILAGRGTYRLGEVTIASGVRHEHKEGSMEQTMYNPFITSTTFAQPIDYDTDRYDLTASYATKRLQGQFGYSYSRFTDNKTSFDLPYYFTNFNAPFQATSAYSLPPGNDAHSFTGMLGYTVTPATRLNANVRYAIQAQDAPFPPATGSTPAQLGSSFRFFADNPGSLGGLARVYGGNVTAASQPADGLDVNLGYTVDGRDVDTGKHAIWGVARPESTIGATPYAFSTPQSWLKQNASAEAGYRILPKSNTRLTLGYAYARTNRSAAQVGQSNESTLSAKVRTAPFTGVTGSLAYDHAVRSARVNFQLPWQLLTGDSGAGFNSLSYYQAARVQEAVKIRATYTPRQDFSAGLFGRFTHDHYNYPSGIGTAGLVQFSGIVRDYAGTVGPDLSWRPIPCLSGHLFYTYQQTFYNNHGIGVPLGWTATTTDHVHTVGLSGEWQATSKVKVSTDYTFYYGNMNYYLFDGVFVNNPTVSYQNVQDLANIPSSMHSLQLRAEYQLAPQLTLWAGYGYDMFKDNDWAYARWPAVTPLTPSGIGTFSGAAVPSYHVHSLMTAVRVRF